jgi:cytochrome c oxidase assembly factor CtaG
VSWRRLAWLCLVPLLASPLVDPALTRTQPRFLLIHVPLWVVLGYLAGRHLGANRRPRAMAWNPLGLTGAVFFVGSLAFWMIPRSVDGAVLSYGMDQLLHANLLAAGFALAWSMPVMPFVLRAALGIYGASMVFSLASLYTYYTALLCGTFTLAEQKQTGHILYYLCPLIVVALLVLGARALGRERAHPAPNGPRHAP